MYNPISKPLTEADLWFANPSIRKRILEGTQYAEGTPYDLRAKEIAKNKEKFLAALENRIIQ